MDSILENSEEIERLNDISSANLTKTTFDEIAKRIDMLAFAVATGLTQGVLPLIAYNYGAKKYDRVRKAFKLASTCGLIASVIAFLTFQLFPRNLISIFTLHKFHFDFYFRQFLFLQKQHR